MCSVEDDQIRDQIAIELLYMVFVVVCVEFAISYLRFVVLFVKIPYLAF